MNNSKCLITIAALMLIGFGLLLGHWWFSSPAPVYSLVPTPNGIATIAPGNSLDVSGTNNITDNRYGKTDQGSAYGDKAQINPGAQSFNLNTMFASNDKGKYLAENIVKSAWIIVLIGAIILAGGLVLSFTGVGAVVAIPVMIIGGIVLAAGLLAMIAENAGWMALLILVAAPIGYMVWKSKQKTATATGATDTLDEITTDIQALAAHVTAGNAAVVQAQIAAMMKKLGL